MNVGDMNIGTTRSQYNTKWKRRARNLPQQSQNPFKQAIGSKKRKKLELLQSALSLHGKFLSKIKVSKKSKIEERLAPSPAKNRGMLKLELSRV